MLKIKIRLAFHLDKLLFAVIIFLYIFAFILFSIIYSNHYLQSYNNFLYLALV